MSIVTDSTPLGTPKPTRGSTLYSLLKLLTSDDEWRPPQQIVKAGQAGPIMSPCITLVIGFHRPGTYLDRAGEWSMVHRFNVPERKRKENGHVFQDPSPA